MNGKINLKQFLDLIEQSEYVTNFTNVGLMSIFNYYDDSNVIFDAEMINNMFTEIKNMEELIDCIKNENDDVLGGIKGNAYVTLNNGNVMIHH